MDQAEAGRRLARVGMTLFLTGLILGLVIPATPVPRLALSAHLLALLQGMFLVLVGLLWPRLVLPPLALRLAPWLAVYGSLAPVVATLVAALWGAGATLLPMSAGSHLGSPGQELTISILLRSAGVSLMVTSGLLIWGLRPAPRER